MSATVKHLHRHIAAREQAIQRRLEAAAAHPKHRPQHKQHKATADRLATEVSALRATVDYQKSETTLASDIERQQVKVEYLLEAWKKAKGPQKAKLDRVLRHENLRLKEMLAAAKLKTAVAAEVLPAVSILPDATAVATEEAAAVATAFQPVQPVPVQREKAVRLLPDDPRDPYISSIRSHERFWSRTPGIDESYSGASEDDGADSWYKNPLVLILVGGAVGWYVAKKV